MKEAKTSELSESALADSKEKEETKSFDIEVGDFDISDNNLSVPEDLDDKTVKYIEKEIRSSFEYRGYISYLKNEMDLTRCALLPEIDIKEDNVSLEFHHYPMTLFEISKIVGLHMVNGLKQGQSVSCFDVAEEVVRDHYMNEIGLVPLTTTLHQMAHTHSIVIPTDKINGNYRDFIARYRKEIPDEIMDRIAQAEAFNGSPDAQAINREKLRKVISEYKIRYDKGE